MAKKKKNQVSKKMEFAAICAFSLVALCLFAWLAFSWIGNLQRCVDKGHDYEYMSFERVAHRYSRFFYKCSECGYRKQFTSWGKHAEAVDRIINPPEDGDGGYIYFNIDANSSFTIID